MEKLTREQVLHVANLARLNVADDEVIRYGEQLSDILTEIEKITMVEINPNTDILIAPTTNINKYKEDLEGSMLTKEEIFKNTKNTDGRYIIVPKVVND